MPTLAALEMFVCVAKKGSFVGAARQLDASKAMASKYVGDIELELGVRLFERTTRSIRLTEAGSEYLKHAEEALEALRIGKEKTAAFGASPKGLLRISAPPSCSGSHMRSVIKSFHDLYPDIVLDMRFEGKFVDLIQHGYDIALRIAELKDSSLVARKLANVPFVVCASPEYLEKHGYPRKPADLNDHFCLNYTHKFGGSIWEFHSTQKPHAIHRIKVPNSFVSNSCRFLVDLAKSGVGITYRPKFEVANDLQSGELISLLDDYPPTQLGLFAVFAPGRHTPEKLRRFVDHIANNLRTIDDFSE